MRSVTFVVVALLSIFRLAGYFIEPRLSDAEIHAIGGESSRIPPSIGARPITIVTWNIERGVQLEKIVATLRALDPDIALLQEVDRHCKRSGNTDVARELAHALGGRIDLRSEPGLGARFELVLPSR